MESSIPLPGGNASGDVVLVEGTVRKSWHPSTPAVHEYMSAIAEAGVTVPRPLGRDDSGRQQIEFISGPLAMNAVALTPADLKRVGALVRSIHDASEGFVPRTGAVWNVVIEPPVEESGPTTANTRLPPVHDSEFICHNDLAPWNLVLGTDWVFIDWDGAGPSTRLWDLAYAASAFTLNDPETPTALATGNLGAFIAGYGAGPALREALPDAMATRTDAMYSLLRSSAETGHEPWASMYATGHGDHWRQVSQYIRQNRDIWTAALSIA